MSVDIDTVKRVAKLSRIAVDDAKAEKMQGELNAILGFVDQLNEVDVEGVEPMTSVVEMDMRKRVDEVNDGNKADDVTANAPASEDNPKREFLAWSLVAHFWGSNLRQIKTQVKFIWLWLYQTAVMIAVLIARIILR